MYWFNIIPINIPEAFQNWQFDSKIHMEKQRIDNSQAILKRISWRTHSAYFIAFYKAIIINTVWWGHQSRDVDKWDRMEPKIDPLINSQLLFNKGAKVIQ